ncbi:MAG: ABC transporter permease [Verrucomicrobia bacterium]|nr:ABC transporter permease [Verrucomicrobiota bacterium]
MRFFLRHVVRYALRHKSLALINILSVALGVSVFLAVQIANRSANAAFRAGIDVVAGRANIEVRGTLDDSLFPRLRELAGVTAATPLVERVVTLPGWPGEYLHVLGIDPFTNSSFENFKFSKSAGEAFDADAWFGDPRSLAVSKSFADAHHLKRGDSIRVEFGERQVDLVVSSVLQAKDGDSHFAAMDIGWAQELFGLQGKLTGVLLQISDPNHPEPVYERIRSLVPPDAVVQEPGARSGQVEQMLSGFELNLTALSMISLLVGVFLIYNTVTASVVRRRSEIGILRALGGSRAKVRWLFLGEAAFYGMIGSVAGCVGGVLMANFLVSAVSTTVTNLYVLTSIDHFYLPFWQIPLVVSAGMASVLVGAWIPANAAANVPPLHALNMGVLIERSERPRVIWLVLSAGCVVAAFGASALALRGCPIASFAAAFFTLIGFCCLSPAATHRLGAGAGRFFRPLLLPRLAARNLVRSLYRHAVTVAALASALAMLVSVSIMIYSFRRTIDRWLARRLVADLFVAPAANEIVGFENFIPEDLMRFLRSQPEVEMIDTFRYLDLRVNGAPTFLGVINGSGRSIPDFLGGKNAEKYKAFRAPDTAIISESLSRRLKVNQGQTVSIATPLGSRRFLVAGVFYDYSRDSGLMLMQEANFEKFWHESRVNSLALYLRPGTDIEKMIRRIRTGYPNAQDYSVYSNRALRDAVVEVFNQTFAVTQVLRVIAVLVAVIGIALNFTVLVKEREREIGTLRAVGVSRRQVRGLIVWESVLVGIMAVLLGVVTGVALSVVLTEVINKAFFGWTIPLQIPWDQLFWTPVWLLPAAVLASLPPANQASRRNIIDIVRTDA